MRPEPRLPPVPTRRTHVTPTPKFRTFPSQLATALLTVAIATSATSAAFGQTAKKALTVDDYSRWRAINSQSISGDGKWVTYVLAQTNTAPADAKPVMHLLRLDTNQDIEVPNASAPAFSADSKWLAYQIDP